MKIDIYTSAINGSKYLSLPVGTKIDSLELPANIDPDLKELSPFKTRLEVNFDKQHPSLNLDGVLDQIDAKGYAVHGAKLTIKPKIAAE